MGRTKKSKLSDPNIHTSNPDAVYIANSIIAFIDDPSPGGYALAKLEEDALESAEDVQVELLQETDQTSDDISYVTTSGSKVTINKIIKTLSYKIHYQKRKNPNIYHIEKKELEGLEKLAIESKKAIKNIEDKVTAITGQKEQKAAVIQESEPESESQEEASSEEEAGEEALVYLDNTPRVFKRVKGPKHEVVKKKKNRRQEDGKMEILEEGHTETQNDHTLTEEEVKQDEDEEDKEVVLTKRGRGAKKESSKESLIQSQKDAENKEEEEKEVKSTKKGRAAKEASASRATKKKAGEEGASVTKKADFESDGEEDQEEVQQEKDQEEPKEEKDGNNEKEAEKDGKEGKDDKKKSKKPKSLQRKPVKTVPDTYQKGKFNTKVALITHHDLLQNKSNNPIDYGCTRTNNKNLTRAVYTKNYTLLENILAKNKFLSTLHEQWGPENDTTALSLALKNKDFQAAKMILDCEYGRTYRFAAETPVHLESVDTGNVSRTAFGVEIRKVNLMRGAREGNNAFTHDLETNKLDINSLFELPMTKELLDYIKSKSGNHTVFSNVHRLVLSGDRINAGYLINLANSVGGYGFNYLYEEALVKDKVSELSQDIKRVSVTKKPIGNSLITPLHCAAINPNVEILDALLQIAPDYSLPDEKMRKLVHYAACCEKPGPLKLLISKSVDPREKDQTGLTPFMYACYYGRAENVEYFIKEVKIDPHEKTKDGMMGAHWAALKGHLGVLKVLVENQVKMTTKGGKSKMTPLHFAAAYGFYDCVEYLVEHKSRVLAKDKLKRTPMCVAVRNGNLQIASYLLFNGSDFEQADSSNNYPLHYAAAYGFTECIDLLVKGGANVNTTNSWKLTALTVAMLKNNFHCVKALLALPNVDGNAKDDHGRSLVSLLIDDPSEENLERITFLIKERNCNANIEDENGLTPLHYACQLRAEDYVSNYIKNISTSDERIEALRKSQNTKIQLIKLLLESGADVNAKTKNQQFPLLFAITKFDPELIELLIEQSGIDVAFHDNSKNNFYRLLYRYSLESDERREFLKRVLNKIGNVSNLLNEEKNDVDLDGTKKVQNQPIKEPKEKSGDEDEEEEEESSDEEMNNETFTFVNSTGTDPLYCNESVFACFKRTLMNHKLQTYLASEYDSAVEKKRQQLIDEEREAQKKQNENSSSSLYYRSKIPSLADIKLTAQEITDYKERAYNKFDGIVEKNLALIIDFVKAGGVLAPSEAVLMRQEYSNDPRFMIWVFESFKSNMNIADSDGNTVLFNLINKRNDLSMTTNAKQFLIDYLVKQGMKADALAVFSDFRLFLEIYQRFGADFNHRNKNGVTPMLHLLKTRDRNTADFLKELAAYGADANQAKDNYGLTPFLEAVNARDLKVMEILVTLGADINDKNTSGKAPLHLITEMPIDTAIEAARILVKQKNIEIDTKDEEKGRTPLHYVILKRARGLVTLFLQAGADPNTTDKDSCNSLYFATQVWDAVLMREVGPSIRDPTFPGFGGNSPLHLAIQNGSEEHVGILLKLGANPNAKDNYGRTALMTAVMEEKLDIVKILLENGGDPNEKDDFERTSLHYAVNNSKPEQMFEMEDILIRNNADVNAVDIYGRSPLHYAFIRIESNRNFHNQNDPVETVTSLSAMQITNTSLRDHRGKSPLHYAAENGAYICVLLLLKSDAGFDEADADGNTPLSLALNSGHKDTAAILIQNKAKVTNMIHHINQNNFLWIHPKDKNYAKFVPQSDGEKMTIEKEGEEKSDNNALVSDKLQQKEPAESDIELVKAKPLEGAMEIEDKVEKKDREEDDDIEEEEDSEESGTEDLDQGEGDAKARELELQELGSLVEDPNSLTANKEEEPSVKPDLRLMNLGEVQRPVDSFFAISIRKGWQGIAYLLLQNGFSLMEAIRDALNEHQFKYVVALMTKVQEDVVRKTDHNGQSLFHIFAMKGHKAPYDLARKIFTGLMNRGVDYKLFDSSGRAPIHYASENNFVFLEDALLEKGVDPNLRDNNGFSVLHLAARTNYLSAQRLEKLFRYKVDINSKFLHYGREITVLHHTTERGAEDVEQKLLALKADPNLEDSEGLTPLQRGFLKKTLSTWRLKRYINHSADINKVFKLKYRVNDQDVTKKYTLLIHAAEKGWSEYEDMLLNNGADASITDNEDRTAFGIALSQRSPVMTVAKLRLYILCRAPLQKTMTCKIRHRNMMVTPVLYLLNTRDTIDVAFLKELLKSGVSINDCDEDGYTAVIYAIRRNNVELLKLFLECPDLDKNMRDRYGKTPIHHVVNPMDYASYENVDMLKLLAGFFDVNTNDDRRKPPIYYAYFQDSGTMKNALLELGATDQKPANEIQRQATSIITGIDWMEEIDFEADAEKYVASQDGSKMNAENAVREPVDDCVHNKHNLQVVYDDELGPYSLYMTKVDIKKGQYGEYIFYRMQVLYDKNRDNYILLTKWGRIGDEGMHQETPFGTKEECVNEFSKIFKDKSGNEWKNKARFQKFDHKFKLLNISNRKNQSDYLQPIDYDDNTLPRSRLELPVKRLMKTLTNVKLYHRWFGRNVIDATLLPFGKLSKELIFEAKKILLELRELIEELQGKSSETDEGMQTIAKLQDKIMDNSSKYYELIPDTRFRLRPVTPIQTLSDLDKKVTMVNDMLDFQVSAKILMGSLSQIKITNPLDYAFEALGIRLMPLSKKQREHKLISKYVRNGYSNASSDFIQKIYALERRGEAERISQWKEQKNRMYLWHGSKLLNFMGILSQGLRIAPPEAPATGYMFGKGIYFADTFAKSYNYCSDYYSSGDNTKLLLICEVALGEISEQKKANYITQLQAPYNSVLGRGRQGPDPTQNITLANGAIVPIGKQIQYPQRDEAGNYIYYSLTYNEYIVYDLSQVRMRYLVQVK